jgi:WD40 repeat protein
MVMAVKLVYHQPSDNMLVVVGYEGGFTAVHLLPRHPKTDSGATGKPILTIARIVYLSQPHTQPVLSLDALPDGTTYFTSAADAIIAAHQIPELPDRNDLEEPQLVTADMPLDASGNTSPFAALSRELKKQANSAPSPVQSPYKSVGTKHAGQQSLRVRSDGRLFVTGGWDSQVRIYSTKTLKEMAVLKWHKEGVYAVDFGLVLDPADVEKLQETVHADNDANGTMMRRETGLGRLQRQREEQVQLRHWVVAGAKDGKVSLWEVF